MDCVDFSKFVIQKFNKSDYVELKIDIEGAEYNLLEKMINEGSIKYIKKIYCEWHYRKIGESYSRNLSLINNLNRLGYNITGENKYDEFKKVHSDKNR